MKSYLLRGGAWAFFGKLATAFFGLLLAGFLARLLSPAEMGLYFLAFNLATFFSILGRGGLENTLLRFIAQANRPEHGTRLRSILKKGLILSAVGAAAAGLLAAIVAPLLGEYIFESDGLVAIAWLVGGWAALLAVQFVFAEIFRGFQEIGNSVWFGGLFTGLVTVSMLSMATLLGFTLELKQVLLLILLSLLTSNGVALIRQHRRLQTLPLDGAVTTGYGELLVHSWPLFINAVTLFLLSQSDLWLLGAYASEQEVAIYGAATRLVMLTAMSLAIVNMVVPPLIARMHAQNDLIRLEKLLRTVATLAAIPALAVLGVFMLFAAPIMEMVYGEYYRAGATVLLILCAGQVVNVLVGSCGYALIMTGHRKLTMLTTLCSAFLAMGLGYFMAVNEYGPKGIAIAYAVASIFQQFSLWLLAGFKCGVWTHFGWSYCRIRIGKKK